MLHAAFKEERNLPSNHHDTSYSHFAAQINFNYREIYLAFAQDVLGDRHQHSEERKLAREDCNKFPAGVRADAAGR